MQKKKETREQLQKRIERAIIHVDRTKETKEIYFSDRGLRLVVNEDVAIVETNFHRHVFQSFTSSNISRPYMYIRSLVNIAIENDCKINNGYSFKKLCDTLKKDKDETKYNIVIYTDWWLMNIFNPLYEIGESEQDAFLVYENYLHNMARNAILFSEKDEDMTNRQFLERMHSNENDLWKDVDEHVIFKKKTDDELIEENIKALDEIENDQFLGDKGNA